MLINETYVKAGSAADCAAKEHPWMELPPSPPTTVAVIEGIATGVPSHAVEQSTAAEQVAELFALDSAQRQRIARVFQKTRITNRYMAVDPMSPEFDEIRRRPSTVRERMTMFNTLGAPLAIDVAERALADSGAAAEEIGLLVFVTSTGLVAPGVDVAVVKALGLAPSVGRVVVNFMGCAAAMNGLRTATDYVRSHPGRKALLVCIELPSVNAVFADNVNDVVISSLFGDGCAAVVVGAAAVRQPLTPGRVVIRDTFCRLLEDAEDGIVLGVNHNGITCELSEQLPTYIYDSVSPVISEVLHDNGLGHDDIDSWAIHPGGPKIIEQSLNSLGLADHHAATSWDILSRYGNMLSVSLLFVLESLIAQNDSNTAISTGMAFSFAPGVAVEGLLFDIVRALG